MNSRGYALIDVLVWSFLGLVVLTVVTTSLVNISRHTKHSRENMAAVSELLILDLNIMRDLEQGSNVTVNDSMTINNIVYKYEEGKLYRDEHEIVAGITLFTVTAEDSTLNVLVERGRHSLNRSYYYQRGDAFE